MGRPSCLNVEQKNGFIKRYVEGETGIELAEAYGISYGTVMNYLKESGVEKHEWSYNIRRGRRLTVNHNAFSEINEETAYWGGFLLADGSMSVSGRLVLELKAEDENHIKKLIRLLGTERIPIYKDPRKTGGFGSYYTEVSSRQISTDLESLFGIVPNKSLITTTPKQFKDNRHFWRGLVDGDGSIGLKEGKNPRLQLAGTLDIVENFYGYISNNIHEIRAKPRQQNNLWVIEICGWTIVPKVLGDLYSDSFIYLDRKKKLADWIINKKFEGGLLATPSNKA